MHDLAPVTKTNLAKPDCILHDGKSSSPKTMDYHVFRNPLDSHAAVAKFGEGGTTGWTQLHGPDSFEGCWTWIRANCTGVPNCFHC